MFAKRYGLRRSYQKPSNMTDCPDILRPLTGIAWLSKVPSPHIQPLSDIPHAPAPHFTSRVLSWFRTSLLSVFCTTPYLLIEHFELLYERSFHCKRCTLTIERRVRSTQVTQKLIVRFIHSIGGEILPQTSFPTSPRVLSSRHPFPPRAHRLSDPSERSLSAGCHPMFLAALLVVSFARAIGLPWRYRRRGQRGAGTILVRQNDGVS